MLTCLRVWLHTGICKTCSDACMKSCWNVYLPMCLHVAWATRRHCWRFWFFRGPNNFNSSSPRGAVQLVTFPYEYWSISRQMASGWQNIIHVLITLCFEVRLYKYILSDFGMVVCLQFAVTCLQVSFFLSLRAPCLLFISFWHGFVVIFCFLLIVCLWINGVLAQRHPLTDQCIGRPFLSGFVQSFLTFWNVFPWCAFHKKN